MFGKRKLFKFNVNMILKKIRIKGQCEIFVNSVFEDEVVLKKFIYFVEEELENGDSCMCKIF